MPEFYKRGTFGKMVKTEETDPSVEEVRLSIEEYNQIKKKMEESEKALQEEKRKTEEHYKKFKNQATELKGVRQELTETKEKAEKREKELIEAIKNANLLNRNLKRISIERANAKRGVTPKKAHDGYLVLYSRQWQERIDGKVYTAWKSLIQTPYDASIPLEQVKSELKAELKDILKELRVDGREREISSKDFEIEENLLYRVGFSASFRSGFWEIEIFTTKGIEVPEHRRPRK